MQIAEFLDRLRAHPEYAGQIEHLEIIPPRAAEYGELERPLPPALNAALARQGVRRLYVHQAAAVNAARAGQDVMVATGTASGKTLCYNLPVLEAALADPLARALYLFPTKALAQDQMRALEALAGGAELRGVTYGPYDGDTPEAVRACPTTPRGPPFSATCATWWWTRPTSTAASSARTWPTCCGGCAASARCTAPIRVSCSARPPSPTPASTPPASSAAP
jgi:ATP-dependent helicase YprA (DUF1998 family)